MAYLEMHNITKRFGSVLANDQICFSVEKGEIHALLGENGAGKSTLMNILFGLYNATEGSIYLNGKPIAIKDPSHAIRQGIGMVHQHFMLVPMFTVIENSILGHKEYRGVLNRKEATVRFRELGEKYSMDVDPNAIVGSLSVGQQQRLEILKALFRDASLLILDEPTAVLTPQEVQELFRILRKLTEDGYTIIFISHKLNEVMEICDRCSVLRQGKIVATMAVSDIKSTQQLASMMVGKEMPLTVSKAPTKQGETVLEVSDLSYHDERNVNVLKHVSFEVRAGEILGVCGVDGNGQSELIKCIAGLAKPTKGHVKINGKDCTGKSPKEVLEQSVSHIPEDRFKYGMIKEMSVSENLILMCCDSPRYSHKGFLDWKWIHSHNAKLCKEYNVIMPNIHIEAAKLSGGNQQKFVVGRELDRKPELLIAVHPTRGLDIGATKYIQERIIETRDYGAAVLMVSTELDEIIEMSDRIMVMFAGTVISIINQKEATRDRLGLLMAGVRE